MAYYQDAKYLKADRSTAYDILHNPGVLTPYSGVYRCENCGNEADSTKGKPLPPEHHPGGYHGSTQWRLIVAAHPTNR